MISAGQKVGDYTLVKKLGEGGMGVVYEAMHSLIGRRVALKLFHPELSQSPHLGARFLTEARAANQVQHPGVVQVHDCGQSFDGSAYLIMELLSGESLDRRLQAQAGQPLSPRQAVALARQVAHAIAAAHEQGVIHRDIKPANIMLVADASGEGEHVKVLDFGIAKLLDGPGVARGRTRTGALIGTAEYMSPEQCRGDVAIDAAIDVYALGVMLYEMLAGQRPFAAESAVETMTLHLRAAPPLLNILAPDLPLSLVGLVHRMLAKQPADRPRMANVAEQLSQLEPSLSSQTSLRTVESSPSGVTAADSIAPPQQVMTVADALLPTPPIATKHRARWPLLGIIVAIGLALFFGRSLLKPRSLSTPQSSAVAAITQPAAVLSPVSTLREEPPEPPPAALKVLGSAAPAIRAAAVRKPATSHAAPASASADPLQLLMRHKEPDGP